LRNNSYYVKAIMIDADN